MIFPILSRIGFPPVSILTLAAFYIRTRLVTRWRPLAVLRAQMSNTIKGNHNREQITRTTDAECLQILQPQPGSCDSIALLDEIIEIRVRLSIAIDSINIVAFDSVFVIAYESHR